MKSAAAPNGRAIPIASAQISSKSVTDDVLGQVRRLPAVNLKNSLVRMKRYLSEYRHQIVRNSSIPYGLRTIF
jgi:hypothetical protein